MRFIQNTFRYIYCFGLILTLLITFSCKKKPTTFDYFPEVGEEAIYQRANELQSNLNVLSLALQPGFEDLDALAYFRLEKGAKIMSAYLTNGEAGESDIQGEYPNYLAAERRGEAGAALAYLKGDVHFLALPHIVAARDSQFIREKWEQSKIEYKLVELFKTFKPDIILFARDWAANSESLRWKIFKDDLLSALHKLDSDHSGSDGNKNWQVARVLVDDPAKDGDVFPVGEKHSRSGKKYVEIGNESAAYYKSVSVQRNRWMKDKTPHYSIVYPPAETNSKDIDSELEQRHTPRLEWTARQIKLLSAKVLSKSKESSLSHLVTILDSVNIHISRRALFSVKDQRALFQWKNGLERLRCSLLGIKVKYKISDDILTMRQLTYITVEEVEGLEEAGDTTVFFGGIENDWIVNEGFQKRFPYEPGASFRLLTPSQLRLNTPPAVYGLPAAKLFKPIMFFIIHHASTKEHSFIHRTIINLKFSPKFSAEILTPIVRMIPGEKLIVRFTNFSRDGVRDTLKVMHELVESTPAAFRLNQKDASEIDTLSLIWKGNPGDGNYVVPLEIKGFNIGNFAVRKFEAKIDSNKNVGIISGIKNSPVKTALTRLGVNFNPVQIDRKLSDQIQNLDVLIIDRRALTLVTKIADKKSALSQFVRNGGHLVYLAQDAEVWNKTRMWDEIELIPTQKFDGKFPIEMDNHHPVLSKPNQIETEDLQEWLYRRAYNIVKVKGEQDIETPLKSDAGKSPLILTKKEGQGRLTYVDLALQPQLLNLQAGAYRIFANLISI